MLEKMGWSEGKGLGANEDGSTNNLKVNKKFDNRGIGEQTNSSDNWLQGADDFTKLLQKLNANYGLISFTKINFLE